jgi:serine/threonine-protein kinase RsbW
MKRPVIEGNKITVPSDHEYLSMVDEFIEGILRGWGTDESIIADIAISVSELVNNAIVHGNDEVPDQIVVVEIGRENTTARISVCDQGTGFNESEIDDPLADENLLKEVGRGIFIVRNLMDTVDIQASRDGTCITITKAIK